MTGNKAKRKILVTNAGKKKPVAKAKIKTWTKRETERSW